MSNDIIPITNAEVVLYQPDENIQLDVRISNDTVWLTRQQMATLFGRDVKTIGKHINNALREELAVSVVHPEPSRRTKNAITAPIDSTVAKNATHQTTNPTVAKFAIVQFEGNRQVERNKCDKLTLVTRLNQEKIQEGGYDIIIVLAYD